MNSKALALSLVLVVFCLAGCQGGNAPDAHVVKAATNNIAYSKDVRSGLCFGTITSTSQPGYQVVSFTTVPCEAVEHLLVK